MRSNVLISIENVSLIIANIYLVFSFGIYFLFHFFKDLFIYLFLRFYLFIHERHRERER